MLKMLSLPVVSLAAFLLMTPFDQARGAGTDRGTVSGGIAHDMPDWFKESFLEIAEDAMEAGEAEKHILLFFNLNNCPYCARMLDESFRADPNMSLIRTHFDAIALNVLGDREVVFNEDITVTEKELAEILNVRATPGILFLDAENRPVARADGYRAPEQFRQILEYVSNKAYRDMNLDAYLEQRLAKDVYDLRDNPTFRDITDLSSIQGPLMVILENGGCHDCAEFHDTILSDERVREELPAYTVVRLDTDANTPVIDVDGSKTTAAGLAEKHQMFYRPGVLLFDRGELVRRGDSLIYPYHFSGMLRYVSGGHYQSMDASAYGEQRMEELLEAGQDIDLGRPGATQ